MHFSNPAKKQEQQLNNQHVFGLYRFPKNVPSSSYHPCIGSFFDFGLHELFSLRAYACPGVLFGVNQIRGKERAVWLLARSLMGILIWSIGDYCKLTEHDGASPIRGAPRLCCAPLLVAHAWGMGVSSMAPSQARW